MSFMELAKDRYSVRKFSDKPVEQDKLDLILQAGQIAPTAHNNQPQRILVLNTAEEMEKLAKCCPFRFHQTLALLVCYDKETSWKRSEFDNADSGDIDMGIVGTHMILQAQELGIGSTWVMHFDAEIARKEFQIPGPLLPTAILMMGYPREDAKPSRLHDDRFEISKTVFYHNF
ncbi:MAG: nitroreductase family protein [Clostridium sp.]|uniref:nitroreductase family protein n=1 Tax=Clostridium sp. TaxID=1506 RepID=UPI00291279DE|nr:nitroreductase family protein [Clostridium sp.]MDU7337174.1 nitroreductase family protein [Clostridium sp.]